MEPDTLSTQLERLRALLTLLAFAHDSHRHDELVEQIRVAIGDVRRSRVARAAYEGQRVTA
jgi:hypothetical protein